ncbi:transmembrane protein 177-like isoform X1 [Dreissena polymorpha]|uniref:transmembrane protein 177-like isoform X1 n=1 Tax=Dreissena polymorpha TaxID=45954 RepID=UPI0022646E6D|nr:transmembrane protein 177-like isoform X1 [Dreissena polymorpha]
MGRILAFAAQASPFLLAGLALGGSMYRLVNHTFYASGKCKKVAVDNNLEKTLSPYLNSMVNKVADNFLSGKISPRDFAEIKFFLAETSEVYSRGSTKTRPCGFIGIPKHFLYQDTKDVRLEELPFPDTKDILDSDKQERLKESLCLSEQAKKFALTSEINSINTYYIHFKFFDFLPLLTGFTYTWVAVSDKLNRVPPLAQIGLICVIALLWTTIGYLFEDMYEQYRINKADRRTAALGDEYIQGGIEYFEKLLIRNQIVRETELISGKAPYNEDGERINKWYEYGRPFFNKRLERLRGLKKEELVDREEKTVS